MSGIKRTITTHTLKARDFIIQNPNNTFPSEGGVMTVTNDAGHITVTRDVTTETLAMTNTPVIDASGSLHINNIVLTNQSSGTAVRTVGDIYINNANLYMFGDRNDSGYITTRKVDLLDLSMNNQHTYVYAADSPSPNLYWSSVATGSVINISEKLNTLAVGPTFSPLFGNNDFYLIPTVNALLQLFSDRGILLKLSG